MSDKSTIEWTDATWNPVRGCTKISPGCAHCYAETFAERFRGVPGHPYEQGFDLRLVPEKLTDPLKWKKPRMIFVNSMSDLFQNGVPNEFIDQCFAVMALAHWHTFQVLTKRASQMYEYFLDPERKRKIAATVMSISNQLADEAKSHKARIKLDDFSAVFSGSGPLENVWLGVSVENKKHGLPRIEHLLQTPAAVRFLSVEPLLEDLNLAGALNDCRCGKCDYCLDVSDHPTNRVDWVIVGCESGSNRRPMPQEAAESIVEQCQAAGVKVFMKQMEIDGKVTGDVAKFPRELQLREYPKAFNEAAKGGRA